MTMSHWGDDSVVVIRIIKVTGLWVRSSIEYMYIEQAFDSYRTDRIITGDHHNEVSVNRSSTALI